MREGICPASAAVVSIDKVDVLQRVLRSKGVENVPDVSADNYRQKTELGDINVREFQDGNLSMLNGDAHRHRRKHLNALVRPEQLIYFREDVIVPSVERWLARAVKPDERGMMRCDLSAVVERTFLEFTAKLIGLQDIETEERMARLRSCCVPMFAGLSASHFADREAVTRAGLEAKRIFVEEYYRPSFEAMKQRLGQNASDGSDVDSAETNLLHMIATAVDERYLDERNAVIESILMFVATTGTSVQAVLSTIDDLLNWLEDHPEDWENVEDLEFLSLALQESLRLRAPFVSYITRLATEDLEVEGCPIKAGDEIHGLIPRAGRDAAVFGPDAHIFNPRREVPKGVNRYGLAFGGGPHQCLGLRVVLGNDGKGGSHIRLLQHFFKGGVQRASDEKPEVLAMGEMEVADNIPTYISYPVVFTKWDRLQAV
ncbi:hypothetical protein BSL82_04520 [Tardibacter chloracetimidivorans]|uniref:Cytochrome P450 n=1 Tax=Tardibacter chloracetimidivorans TaxID=1921510 RepID=A0A1L3ZSR0_9SPHN|nr:cytochrome P450 [Tardibacter chloracetimidivorans]API58664.1 hypothetical protein BSL82_04520 [Tardibacter chloracetimidivorans]